LHKDSSFLKVGQLRREGKKFRTWLLHFLPLHFYLFDSSDMLEVLKEEERERERRGGEGGVGGRERCVEKN
jgi:hypothetical protein